jgi:hypothetical protein
LGFRQINFAGESHDRTVPNQFYRQFHKLSHIFGVDMMSTLSVNIEPQTLSLKVSDFSEEVAERIAKRLVDLKPLLEEILRFDDTTSDLSGDEFGKRRMACAAMDLKYQLMLSLASDQARLAREISEGTERIADHGYPEFDFG